MCVRTARYAYCTIEAVQGRCFETELGSEIVPKLDLCEACGVKYIPVQACVWIPTGANRRLK